MSDSLPAGVSCRVHINGVVVEIAEPRCPFEVMAEVERKLGIVPKDVDERFDKVMARRWELEPLPKKPRQRRRAA